MTTTDAALLPPNKRKSFYAEEEEIIIKPSTELIPDEYEHSNNSKVLLHVFRCCDEDGKLCTEDVLYSFKQINYTLDDKANVHEITTNQAFFEDLEKVKKESAQKDALVLMFIGYYGKDDASILMPESDEDTKSQDVHISDIWNMFVSHNCPELKNKPKVFIFCTFPKRARIQTDSSRNFTMKYEKVYDFPTESDILVVYQKQNDFYFISKFITQLCNNIIEFSGKHDIIDLLSYLHADDYILFPLIISTLTRKFYLTPSNEREHHLSFMENLYYLDGILKKIHTNLQKIPEPKKSSKDSTSIFGMSFRKKKEEKPKVVEKKNKEKMKKKAIVEPVTSDSNPGPSRNSMEERGSRRTSTSESKLKSDKPPWRF